MREVAQREVDAPPAVCPVRPGSARQKHALCRVERPFLRVQGRVSLVVRVKVVCVAPLIAVSLRGSHTHLHEAREAEPLMNIMI